MTTIHWFLCALLLSCTGGPDELHTSYGHTFAGDSNLEGWEIRNEDSDEITIGLVWYLNKGKRPERREYVHTIPAEPQEPESDMQSETWLQNPAKLPEKPVAPNTPVDSEEDHSTAMDHVKQDGIEIAESFDAMDWLTRILLAIIVGWILWVFRKRIGRLTPGFNGRRNDNT